MAMKLHHAARDPWQELEKLSRTVMEKFTVGFSHQRDIQARIMKDKMLVRVQHTILLHKPEMPKSWYKIQLCYHTRTCFNRSGVPLGTLGTRLACKLLHHKQLDCEDCSGLKQCYCCPTEYQINVLEIGDRISLIVTAWQDLGLGLTPRDPVWINHHSFKMKDKVPFEPGSIKEEFEGNSFSMR